MLVIDDEESTRLLLASAGELLEIVRDQLAARAKRTTTTR